MLKSYLFALLTGLCLLLGPAAQAQVQNEGLETLPRPEETPWSHLVDSLTANLSKSPVTTGILYDRAVPLAGLHRFGVRRPDTTSSVHLRQAYLELWVAAYNRGTFRCTPEQLRARANRVVGHDPVPLALRYRFNYLDPLAVPDNLLRRESTYSSRLHDVPGRPRSPFLLREVAVAAALVPLPVAAGGYCAVMTSL